MKTNECIQLMHRRLDDLYGRAEVEAMARMVMDEVLHYSPVDMVLREQHEVPDFFPDKLDNIVSRLERHEPIQYILGVASFHGHRFAVTPATLIPRPETEQLVDLIVDEYRDREDLRVLDVGTGSGCIAISLARALKFAQVTGTDISEDALQVARDNARALKAQVSWLKADMLRMSQWPSRSFDILVSNPPYICESERAKMERNVLDYEPSEALFVPDHDPLVNYRALAFMARAVLTDGGRIYVEINRRFGQEVALMFRQVLLSDVRLLKDSFGNDRFVVAQL